MVDSQFCHQEKEDAHEEEGEMKEKRCMDFPFVLFDSWLDQESHLHIAVFST